MKIAFFTDSYYPQLNGVTVSVENFAKELRKNGHTVYIFAPKMKRASTKKDENVIFLPSLKILSSDPAVFFPVPASYTHYKQLLRLDFDVVHAHGNGLFSLLGYQIAKMKQVPFILTFHSMHSKYTHYFLNGKILKPNMVEKYLQVFASICDAIVTPSEKMKKELKSYGVKKPVTVIPNFVHAEQLTTPNTHFLHKKLEIPVKEPLLVTVGRVGKEKNFAFLIRMFKELEKIDKTSHLVIVGGGSEKAALQDLVKELDLQKRIHFTGRIAASKMPLVYADASVFVFSSETEVHPMVTLEACAAGLPIVVGHDEAFDGAVVDGFNGFRLPLKEKVFSEKINILLNDAQLRQKFSENSREIIKKHFAAEVVVENLMTFYEKTISEQKGKEKNLRSLNKAALIRLRKTASLFNRIFN